MSLVWRDLVSRLIQQLCVTFVYSFILGKNSDTQHAVEYRIFTTFIYKQTPTLQTMKKIIYNVAILPHL